MNAFATLMKGAEEEAKREKIEQLPWKCPGCRNQRFPRLQDLKRHWVLEMKKESPNHLEAFLKNLQPTARHAGTFLL